jgi:hypothetical protein
MTDTVKRIIGELKSELDELPEEEQEAVATSYLRDLRRRKQQREQGQPAEENGLYGPFQIMLDADLDLPSDYSETYEEHLCGTPASDD